MNNLILSAMLYKHDSLTCCGKVYKDLTKYHLYLGPEFKASILKNWMLRDASIAKSPINGFTHYASVLAYREILLFSKENNLYIQPSHIPVMVK